MNLTKLRARRHWYYPASHADMDQAERQLGYKLPRLLAVVYKFLGNGTVGADGTPESLQDLPIIMPLEESVRLALSFAADPGLAGLFPFADFGCANWMCAKTGSDFVYRVSGEDVPFPIALDLEQWLTQFGEGWPSENHLRLLCEAGHRDMARLMLTNGRLIERAKGLDRTNDDCDLNPHLQLTHIADQVVADVRSQGFSDSNREEVYLMWLTTEVFKGTPSPV
jgi:hypothetical protein